MPKVYQLFWWAEFRDRWYDTKVYLDKARAESMVEAFRVEVDLDEFEGEILIEELELVE